MLKLKNDLDSILRSVTEIWTTFLLFRPFIFFSSLVPHPPSRSSLEHPWTQHPSIKGLNWLNWKEETEHCGKSALDIDMNYFSSEEQNLFFFLKRRKKISKFEAMGREKKAPDCTLLIFNSKIKGQVEGARWGWEGGGHMVLWIVGGSSRACASPEQRGVN